MSSPLLPGGRQAIVIGAGLAGAAISQRLASRGWQIALFDRRPGPAQEASGNPVGIVLPLLTRDDSPAARLSRRSFLYALQTLTATPNVRWSPCGVLQIARDAEHEAVQRATVEELGLPLDFVRFLDQAAAESLVGQTLVHGGWWFPAGGWVDPASFCAALIAAGESRISTHFDTEVAALRQVEQGWQALNAEGKALAAAPQLILANAHDANRLLTHFLPLTPIRGQVSYLPEPVAPKLNHVLCRNGYLTPIHDGIACLGASFDRDDTDLSPRIRDHQGNLERLEELIPGAARQITAEALEGRAGLRTAATDRLPLVGKLPDPDAAHAAHGEPTLATLPRLNGLHALLGLGARGLVWAPLAAELLACQLNEEPLPIDRDLAEAVDPARFHLKERRRPSAKLVTTRD